MEGVLRRLSSGRQRCRYKTYPHVDYVERAAEATRLIAGMINKTCRPTMAATKPPMIPMYQPNPMSHSIAAADKPTRWHCLPRSD